MNMERTFLFLLIILPIIGNSQISTSYTFGNITLDKTNISTYSGPLIFSQEKDCLQVDNGVNVFTTTSIGSIFFSLICDKIIEQPSSIFKLFPNPSPGYTRIYSNIQLSATEITKVSIFNSVGHLVSQQQVNSLSFQDGLPIHSRGWANGVYIVSIYYRNQLTTLKFINNKY